ncbi:MAG: hypothetical protein QM756_05935 [Polyangiaceae bacterium]
MASGTTCVTAALLTNTSISTPLGEHGLDRRLHVGGVAHVALEHQAGRALRTQELEGLLGLERVLSIGEGDPRAFPAKGQAQRAPKPTRAARNQTGFTFQATPLSAAHGSTGNLPARFGNVS